MPVEENAGVEQDAAEEFEQETAEESEISAQGKESGSDEEAADAEETESEQAERTRLSGHKRLKLQRDKAYQERDFWREEALRNRQLAARPQAVQAPPKELTPPAKPQVKDFDDYEKYEAAKDKYFEELADYKSAKRLQDFQAQQIQQQQFQKVNAEIAQAREKFADFEKVSQPIVAELMNPASGIAQSVLEAIGESELFAELVYVIGSDAKEAKELLQLAKQSPTKAIEQIGVLKQMIREERANLAKGTKEEDEGAEQSDERSQSSRAAVSRAPAPVKPVRKSGQGAIDLNDAKVPYKDWLKARNAQIKRANQ